MHRECGQLRCISRSGHGSVLAHGAGPAGVLEGNTMKVLRRSRRLVWAGGCAALALGMAGAADAVSAPAQARVTAILVSPMWRRAGATTRKVSWVTGPR